MQSLSDGPALLAETMLPVAIRSRSLAVRAMMIHEQMMRRVSLIYVSEYAEHLYWMHHFCSILDDDATQHCPKLSQRNFVAIDPAIRKLDSPPYANYTTSPLKSIALQVHLTNLVSL